MEWLEALETHLETVVQKFNYEGIYAGQKSSASNGTRKFYQK